ncbi:MAG TPA: hypothetical protein VG711_08855 [Phycisphaerales bacterium]|nr:hypothetical protein [Phycisphaerales bacterium]
MADRVKTRETTGAGATPKKKRWWLRIVIAIVAVIVVLVALAPTLVSLGLGQGYIESKINDSLNGKVSLGKVGLGWLGGQKVEGLTVTDAAGNKVVTLDVRISSSLLGLVTGTSLKMDVQVNGEASGELREDGSISFSDLIKQRKETEKEKKEREEREKKTKEPTSIAGLPDIAIEINSLTVNLRDVKKNRVMKVENLKGSAQLAKGKDTTLELTGALSGAAAGSGQVNVNMKSAGLFDAKGVMHLADASLNAKVEMQQLPVPIDATLDSMDHVVVTADAAKLSDSLNVGIDGAGTIQGIHASSASATSPGATVVKGDVTIGQPVNAKGVVKINPAKVTGSVEANNIPTALAQAALASTPVNVIRDVGPRVDLKGEFGEGEKKNLHITFNTERIQGEVRGDVGADGAVNGTFAHFEASVAPELLLQSTGLLVDKPAQVVMDFSKFTIPAAKAEGGLALGDLSATGTLKIVNSAVVKTAEGELIGGVGPMEVAIESPGLGQWVSVKGGGMVAQGTVKVDERVAGLIDSDGTLTVARAMPTGTLELVNLPAEFVKRIGKIQPDSVIVNYVVSGLVGLKVETKEEPAGMLAVNAEVTTDVVNASATATKAGEDVTVKGVEADLKLTPEFVAEYQKSLRVASADVATSQAAASAPAGDAKVAVKPIKLVADATVHGSLEGFTLARTVEGGYALPTAQPLVLNVKNTTDVELDRVPGLSEAVAIRGLDATIDTTLGELATYVAKGDVQIRRADGNAVANVGFDVNAKKGAEGFTPGGTVNVTDFSVGQLEKLMGAEAGSFTQWTGADKGGIKVEVSQSAAGATDAKLHADFANLAGDFTGGMNAQEMWLSGETTKFIASKEAIQKFLRSDEQVSAAGETKSAKPTKKKAKKEEPADADEKDMAPPPHVTVAADVPGKLKVSELRLPMGVLEHSAFDPTKAKMNVSLSLGTLTLNHESGMRSQLSGIAADVTSDGFNNGVSTNVKADASVAEAGANGKAGEMMKAGGLTIVGKVTDLMAEDSTLDVAEAKWHADGKAKNIPMALIDAFGNMNGYMTATLGPTVQEATFQADDLSPTGGTLNLHVQTENGSADLPLRAKGNALRPETRDTTLQATLQVTKALTEKVLQSLHPIFTDIRTVKDPIQFNVTNLVMPLNGDVSGLKGDATITVGDIELDSGSALLQVIKFAGRNEGTIKGFIDPIKITVRNGVIKYDTFSVKLDKFTMKYTGTIDLVKKEVNLKTEVPLEALGSTFQELKGVKTVVPIVTTGKIGSVKTKIDPSFDIGKAALEAGFRGKLEDLLGGKKDEEKSDGKKKGDGGQ